MRKAGLLSLGFVLATSVLVLASAPILTATMDVAVEVSPQTIILHADGPTWVTAHADIPYDQVDGGTVYLDGISATRTEADLCGNLVALFAGGEVKEILEPGFQTLTLTGLTVDQEPFTGSATVRVRP